MEQIAKVQQEASVRWENAGRRGTVAGATGTGKTKIALDRIKELFEIHKEKLNVLVAVPTEKLRDVNWPDDAKKWGVNIVYDLCVQGVCYVSAHKVAPQHFHLIVLDEGHHITPLSAQLFDNVTYDELLVLTATRPGQSTEIERWKKKLLDDIAPTVFEYPVEQAVNDGVVNDFTVHVVYLKLDDKIKNMKSGNAKKTWYVTEFDRYNYLDNNLTQLRIQINKLETDVQIALLSNQSTLSLQKKIDQLKIRYQIAIGARAQFIYNLPSKTAKGKELLGNIQRQFPGKRTLVFSGSINQSKEICGTHVFNSKSDDVYFNKFMNEEIDYLGVVNAMDEGQNIPNLDFGLLVQVSSVGRRLVQRLGRIIRRRLGVTAELFLLVVKDTVDEKWAESALEDIPVSKIKRYAIS